MANRLLGILVLVGLVALSFVPACARDEARTADPTVTPSSRPPVPERPELPTEAQDNDYAGAVAFVEYYYELYEYGASSKDWDPLKEVSAARCVGCKKFWKEGEFRKVDFGTVSANSPSLNDLIDGVAQVNVSMRDEERTKMDGDLRLSWGDTVKCRFRKDRWEVISIKSETY